MFIQEQNYGDDEIKSKSMYLSIGVATALFFASKIREAMASLKPKRNICCNLGTAGSGFGFSATSNDYRCFTEEVSLCRDGNDGIKSVSQQDFSEKVNSLLFLREAK